MPTRSLFARFLVANILAAAALASCYALAAQTAPAPAPNSAQTAISQSPSGVMTLRVGTHLVELDVSVLDWKGSPVTGLKKDAFHLLEDGQEQTIKSFEEHVPVDPAIARKQLDAVAAKLPPNTFTNFKPFPGGTVNVVVMDSLTSRPDTQNFFLSQIWLSLSQIPPGTPFIFLHLDSQLHMVQEMTMDPVVMRSVLKSNRLGPFSSPGTTYMQKRQIIGSAIDQLSNYLSGIPNKKTVLWFSGGLGGAISSTGNNYDDPDINDLLCKWTDELQQHRIDSYRYLPQGRFVTGLNCARGINIGESIGTVVDVAAHFYTITYTPTNPDWNGRYRKIKVNATATGHHGVTLDYRPGYYGRPDDGSVRSSVVSAPPAPSPENPAIQQAMAMGSPEPDAIVFEATATPNREIVRELPGTAASPSNYLSADLRTQGYRELAIHFAVRSNQLQLIAAPNQTAFAEKLQVVAVLYDSAGHPVNSKKSTVSVSFTGPDDPLLQKATVTADVTTQIPAKGPYFLRLGVRDIATDKVGALEIPVDRITVPKEK
jgi:VWFA-related protein